MVQSQNPNRCAHQPKGRVSHSGGHAADLTVFPFGEGEADPRGWHTFAKTNGRITRWMHGLGIERGGHATLSFEIAEVNASLQLE